MTRGYEGRRAGGASSYPPGRDGVDADPAPGPSELPLAGTRPGAGGPPSNALLRIVIPAALPAILTGARIGLVGAIVGVFLAEMIAGADGLGHQMAISYRTLDTPEMYVAIIAVSLVGYALDRAFLLVRRRALAWSEEG